MVFDWHLEFRLARLSFDGRQVLYVSNRCFDRPGNWILSCREREIMGRTAMWTAMARAKAANPQARTCEGSFATVRATLGRIPYLHRSRGS